jgi:hypothetical protein
VDLVLAGAQILPDETVNYIARVAPRLGPGVAMTGPLAAYAQAGAGGGYRTAYATEADLAYAGGGMSGAEYWGGAQAIQVADDPSLRAFEGGGLVTPDAPTGRLTPAWR